MVGKRTPAGDGGTQLSADLIFEVLADKHRRVILRTLHRHEHVMTVERLVGETMTAFDDESADTASLCARLSTRFCHVHLPKLTDVEVIEYWPQENLVEPNPVIEEFQPFLVQAESFERHGGPGG